MASKNSASLSKLEPQSIPLLALPWLAFAERRRLPNVPAVYFVINVYGTILYIGQTESLLLRWLNHRPERFEPYAVARIAWLLLKEVTIRLPLEKACIAYFDPLCNRPRRPYRPQKRGYVKERLELPLDLYEWARLQPGSLPALIREVLWVAQRSLQRVHVTDDFPLESKMIRLTTTLPPDLLEWAKDQPEGFAGLVRALLRDEHRRRATGGG